MQITIVISDGMLTNVFADRKDIDIQLLDSDCTDITTSEEVETAVRECFNQVEKGKLFSVY